MQNSNAIVKRYTVLLSTAKLKQICLSVVLNMRKSI